jgi:alpha-1,3-mannosyltransferase
MRIVHVVRQFYPSVGGLENVVLELAKAQAAIGHFVRIVTLDRLFRSDNADKLPAVEQIKRIEVIRIPYVGSSRYPLGWSVIKHIKDADIVHVHAIDFFFDYLAWTKPFHRKRLVVSTHGGFFHTSYAASLKSIWFATVTNLSLRSYAAAVAVSVSDCQRFEKIRPGGVVCIENGVNIAKFANASSSIFKKSIVSIGRFSQNKRLDQLISFISELRRRDREWTLTIAGAPSDLRGDDLIALCEASGVLEAVTVIESPSDNTIKDIMNDSSFIASASEYEGFGVAAVEGMSAGLFPLLSDIPPFRRLIGRIGVGLLFDFSDAGASAQKLLEFEQVIKRSYDQYRYCFADAVSVFDWQHVSQAYLNLYEAAIGTKVRDIINIPIRVQTFSEAVEFLDLTFSKKKQSVVTFANANTLTLSTTHEIFRKVLQESIVFNDGIGVDFAGRLLYGSKFRENLNGTDFVPNYLLKTCHRYRIFLLGAKPGVAERAAGHLRDLSRHKIVGCHHGYFDRSDVTDIVKSIRSTGANVVLVALGNPLQELWLHEHLVNTGCILGFGVGALFDFLAGEVPRASPWVRRLRVEWAYRLSREPRRLARRYLVGNLVFIYKVFKQLLSGQRVTISDLGQSETNEAASGGHQFAVSPRVSVG